MAAQGQGQQIKAKWGLQADWDKDTDSIIIIVEEELSGKKWKVALGKESYNNPREAYDKIRPVIDGGNMEVVGGMPANGQNLTVKITKGYEAYEWNLPQV
mmetsp:Transcript_44475/g.71238  ORF Transcript_44475/g.71238 Transcript_44475/m.71238 type:complete len:100 (-) Transcript_44475:116-415(-)|eukprot:CAMPEP_0197064118 /NCGR_PEP_ID=MMETSP1384-20130603/157169_1 /TAXON_ID=29189 /ORGANISM="Ammonia sp." /LENGTH=99 /DNA_ID=CAMNT_0042500551 /DNA_START=13 /DNA_END=312 /DNA_ORIENTATION=-